MTDDIFAADKSNTPLSPEEQLDLIPSLSTRAELNEAERTNIHAARVWAMRPRTLKRSDLLTDAFARELHKRMFNQTCVGLGVIGRPKKILDGKWRASPRECEMRSMTRGRGWNFPPTLSTNRPFVSTTDW
jgi:fido (protein-threonine AMPylation protein)